MPRISHESMSSQRLNSKILQRPLQYRACTHLLTTFDNWKKNRVLYINESRYKRSFASVTQNEFVLCLLDFFAKGGEMFQDLGISGAGD